MNMHPAIQGKRVHEWGQGKGRKSKKEGAVPDNSSKDISIKSFSLRPKIGRILSKQPARGKG
jgi:hypothetical protein